MSSSFKQITLFALYLTAASFLGNFLHKQYTSYQVDLQLEQEWVQTKPQIIQECSKNITQGYSSKQLSHFECGGVHLQLQQTRSI